MYSFTKALERLSLYTYIYIQCTQVFMRFYKTVIALRAHIGFIGFSVELHGDMRSGFRIWGI